MVYFQVPVRIRYRTRRSPATALIAMTIVFESRQMNDLPIDARGINPAAIQNKSLGEIHQLTIRQGNQQTTCGECFEISSEDGRHDLEWRGNLTHVHSIGRSMRSGHMVITGSAGHQAGAEMVGGTLELRGNAGNQLGAEMRGGLIVVSGCVGDQAGGAFPGSARGMRGGEILIHGNAGRNLGCRMRRGLIAVAGSTDDFVGYRMAAGTILTCESCGQHVGSDMVRGTILCLAGSGLEENSTAFHRGNVIQSNIFRLLHRRLKTIGFAGKIDSLLEPLQIYHGDSLNGCRGEVLFAV